MVYFLVCFQIIFALMTLTKTPESLKNIICGLNGILIEDSLTDYIQYITNTYDCLFVNDSIKKSGVHIFKCQHGSRDRGTRNSTKKFLQCMAMFRIRITPDRKAFYLDGIWLHNHAINRFMNNIHHSNLSDETIELIRTGITLGTSSGSLRRSLKLVISPDQLYHYRRIFNQSCKCQFDELQNNVSNWTDFIIHFDFIKDSQGNKHLNAAYFLSKHFLKSGFVNDIWIIDDTECTNKFHMPIFAIIIMDENGKNQLLSFCFLPGKKEKDIIDYFEFLKTNGQNLVRMFICDRCTAQVSAISHCFPSSHIIFCINHIRRNIDQNFGNGEISKFFKLAINTKMPVDSFLEIINAHIQNESTIHIQSLKDLIKSIDRWYPTITDKMNHCGNFTTNRIEGEFGILKNRTSHEILTLSQIVDLFKVRHDEMIQSRYKKNYMEKPFISNSLISSLDLKFVGYFASSMINQSYKQYCEGLHHIQECNCIAKNWYGLPCCHVIDEFQKNNQMLTLDHIPKRWIVFNDIISNSPPIIQDRVVGPEKEDWAYNAIKSKMDPIISMATSDSRIQKLISDLFQAVEYMKTIPKNNDPITILKSGRRNSHPSNNVDKNYSKGKYKYSICGKTGHNAARCQRIKT